MSNPTLNQVSIVVLTYNGLLENTKPCLDSVLANTAGEFELITVDNGSVDGTPKYLSELAERYPNVRIKLNGENKGYAAGNNDGIKMATGEYIVLLNNDTLVPKGWLSPLISVLQTRTEVGLVGPVTNSAGNEQRIDLPGLDETNFIDIATPYIEQQSGHWFTTQKLGFFCVAMRRQLIDEIGMLDEQFGIGMFEDDDFCVRALQAGYKLAVVENGFVYHKGSASFKKLSVSEAAQLFTSNRDYFYEKHAKYWAFSDIALAIWKKINDDIQIFAENGDAAVLNRVAARQINLAGALSQLKEIEISRLEVKGQPVNEIKLAEKQRELMEMSDWASGLRRTNEALAAELAAKTAQLNAITAQGPDRHKTEAPTPPKRWFNWIKRIQQRK